MMMPRTSCRQRSWMRSARSSAARSRITRVPGSSRSPSTRACRFRRGRLNAEPFSDYAVQDSSESSETSGGAHESAVGAAGGRAVPRRARPLLWRDGGADGHVGERRDDAPASRAAAASSDARRHRRRSRLLAVVEAGRDLTGSRGKRRRRGRCRRRSHDRRDRRRRTRRPSRRSHQDQTRRLRWRPTPEARRRVEG